MKDHMRNPDNPKCTRCGLPTDKPHIKRIYAFEYGSPKATCKMCQRLYALDVAMGGDDQ